MRNHFISLASMMLALLVVTAPTRGQFDALRKFAGGEVEDVKQIAYFNIKGRLTETPTNMPPLFGSEPPMSLMGLLERLKEARRDNSVVAVVIDLQHAALGTGQLEEIHRAMKKFAAVDKEVYVHADTLSTLTYAVATGASHLSMVPTGDLWLIGLYGETPYLRGALDKIGCVPDFEQFEDFKTAAESLTRTEPSAEAKKMSAWLLDGLYEDIVKLIADSRGFSAEKVRRLIDGGPYSAEDALKAGLIDSVKHRQDFVADLKTRYGDDVEIVTDYAKRSMFDIPDGNIFAAFEALMKLFNPVPTVYTDPSVAVIHVEGAIQTGSAEKSLFGTSAGAFSTTIRKALDTAASDDSVKAVVLRVDSPGGSALASEIILDAAKRVAAKKPIVVSMGNVAASGGYYVTCASEMIFADRTTITASIGVIGGKIVTTGMWAKLGVNWHAVQRGEMAGIMSTAQPFSDPQRVRIRHYMKTIYEVFKGHVVAARGDKLTKPIGEIAGGRVFTGRQALELGLVDKIGGIEDAIKYAAGKASLGEYEIRVIPEPPSIFDFFGGGKDNDEFVRSGLSLVDLPLFRTLLPTIARVDPIRAGAIIRALRRIELIHDEHVITMMPDELVIR